MEFKQGDKVMVRRPEQYAAEFAKKVSNRPATVDRVFTPLGGITPRVVVRFGKRDNRGKVFIETFLPRDLEMADA